MKIVAILSTTVLPLDGVYKVKTTDTTVLCSSCQGEGNWYPSINEVEICPVCGGEGFETVDLSGIPHYIGHPATKNIVEKLGAIPAPSRLFTGLKPGEQALAFAIKQGRSNRTKDGFSNPHQDVGIEDLSVRVITRIE